MKHALNINLMNYSSELRLSRIRNKSGSDYVSSFNDAFQSALKTDEGTLRTSKEDSLSRGQGREHSSWKFAYSLARHQSLLGGVQNSFLLFVFIFIWVAPLLDAQAIPTASRAGNLQIGTMFDLASSDYTTSTFKGFGFYGTFDFKPHLGVEAEFHQLYDPNATEGIYERTYEIGPRYVMHFGRFSPYAKLMVGRGVFNFPPDPRHPDNGPVANLAYTIWAGGIGVDYKFRPSINVRADYEFQRWNSFPPNGLSPRIFSVGVAYHFH
jgi:opacity protein-like surface antigen